MALGGASTLARAVPDGLGLGVKFGGWWPRRAGGMVVQHIGVISVNAVCKLKEEGIDINNALKAYLLLYEHLLFIPQISEDDYYGPSVIWNQVSNASHEAIDPESPRFKHAIISLNDYVPESQRPPSELARRANRPLHPLIERHRKYRELLVDAFILNYMNTKASVPDTELIDPFTLSDIAMGLAAKDFFGCNSGLLCGAHKERYVAAVTPTYPCCFDSDHVRLVRASIEPAVEAHRASLPEIGSAFTTHLQSATEEVARFVRADGLTAFTWDQLLELREDRYFPAFRKRIHKANFAVLMTVFRTDGLLELTKAKRSFTRSAWISADVYEVSRSAASALPPSV